MVNWLKLFLSIKVLWVLLNIFFKLRILFRLKRRTLPSRARSLSTENEASTTSKTSGYSTTSGVNFTIILWAAFFYVSVIWSFLQLHFGFVIFWWMNISTKAAYKILWKLTILGHHSMERLPTLSAFDEERIVSNFWKRWIIDFHCLK